MFKRIAQLLVIFVAFSIVLTSFSLAEWPPRELLLEQADSFVTMLDQQQYDDAWLATSQHFQGLTNQQEWFARQHLVRSAYGPLASREFYRLDYRRSYHESPDGQYVIVQFKSSFSNKAHSIETIVYACSAPSIGCRIREYIIQ